MNTVKTTKSKEATVRCTTYKENTCTVVDRLPICHGRSAKTSHLRSLVLYVPAVGCQAKIILGGQERGERHCGLSLNGGGFPQHFFEDF